MVAAQRAARWGLIGSGAWLCLVLVVDVANSQPTFALTVLYAIAPLMACAVLPPARTGVVAAVAAAVAVASGQWNGTTGTAQQAVRLVDVVLVSVGAVVVSAVRVRRERQVARLTEVADVAQRAILPVLPERPGPVAVAARYEPAAHDTKVGGDLYDCYRYTPRDLRTPERVRFIVGDVRGKGITAVEQAARVIRAFRQSAGVEATLPLVAEAMDEYLTAFFGPEDFASALLVDVTHPGNVRVVSCGHPPALMCRAGGQLSALEAPVGLPLGVGVDGGAAYEEVVVPWSPGDRLLLYTDGLSEARDRRGRFLPLATLDVALHAPDLSQALDAVMLTITKHTPGGHLTDDLALLLLENACDQVPERADAPPLTRALRALPTTPSPGTDRA